MVCRPSGVHERRRLLDVMSRLKHRLLRQDVAKQRLPFRAVEYASHAAVVNKTSDAIIGVDHHASRFVVTGAAPTMLSTNDVIAVRQQSAAVDDV